MARTERGTTADTPDANSPRYYHGTKADWTRGDLIEPGHPDGSGATPELRLTSSLDAAAWEAELTVGDGTGRIYIVYFFQAEDGIRDYKVTGVQTCALPI